MYGTCEEFVSGVRSVQGHMFEVTFYWWTTEQLKNQTTDSSVELSMGLWTHQGSAWKTALALLAESKSSRLEPDVVTYNSALSACATRRHLLLCSSLVVGCKGLSTWIKIRTTTQDPLQPGH